MLTPREAFKVGFLQRCAEAGMSEEETHAHVKQAIVRLEKQAAGEAGGSWLSKIPGVGAAQRLGDKGVDVLASLFGDGIRQVVGKGLGAAIVGPPIIGAGLGYAGAQLTDLNDEDAQEYRSRELIDEYHRNAILANYSAEARRRQLQRQRRPRA